MSACQGYGQANQITVCVHDAKANALRGIEAAEDSSATNLECSNLREKQKEAIISFVSYYYYYYYIRFYSIEYIEIVYG